MADQLSLPLPFRTAMGRGDFFESSSNAEAVRGIDAWRTWTHAKMMLVGPEGAGKTHLVHVWAEQSGARIVAASDLVEDDVARSETFPGLAIEDLGAIAGDRGREEIVFHIHNAMAAQGLPLLITACSPAGSLGLVLPDLQSRMQQAGLLRIDEPDDRLLAAVMVKQSADRGMRLTPQIVNFAVANIERSLAAVGRFVATLDTDTMAAGRKPSLSIAKSILLDDEA